jgi:hypothetical protein
MYSATRRVRDSFACSQALAFVFCLLSFFSFGSIFSFGQVQVLTEHNDASRSGANTQETYLTTTNVNFNTFGKLFTEAVDGFIVGQPLFVPGVQFHDGSTHNVVYVATQHDGVFAFDGDREQAPLWTTSFINPSAGITTVPISDYGCAGTAFTEIGVVSTPVIDATAGTIFILAKTLENGAYIYRLHALSLTTGADVVPPAVISASVSSNSGTVQFDPAIQMQRPGLLLENGAIYIGFGSNGCDTYAFRGWLLAYDETTLQQNGAFLTTPNGTRGGVWLSGGGAAADADGNVFLASGNGTFDAHTGGADYGDSLLRFSPTSSGLTVIDYFTPYNQQDMEENDLDLGAGGVVVLPDQAGSHPHEVVGVAKTGTLYLVDRDSMGGYNASGDTQIVQSIPGASAGKVLSVPGYWNGNLYLSGETDHIKAFSLSNGLLSTQPTSQTSITASIPGSVSISANGTSNGILWDIPINNPATLYAFDATNLSTLLYSSTQAGIRDQLGTVPKFEPPTVANGKIYIGGASALVVYGLLPRISAAAGNSQSAYVGTTLPVALQIQTVDSYQGNAISGVSVTCKDGGVGGTFGVTMPMVTNSQGQAATTYTLPKKAQTVTITCTSSSYVSGSFTEVGIAGPVTRAAIVSGNRQTGPVSTPLPASLVTQILDPYGFGVPGVTVTYSDGGAGGSFSPVTVLTDSLGDATTSYKTPANPGAVTITATTTGLAPVKFAETVVTGGPNFSLSAAPGSLSVTQGSSGSPTTITVNPTGGFTGSVTFTASGLPSGVTAAFNPATTTSSSTLTLTASSSATTGPATITVTGTSGSTVQTTNISLTVNPPQNFSLSAAPGLLSVTQGSSSSPATITVNPTGGFTGSVALTASGLPSGVTAAFNPATTTSTSALTLTASGSATSGPATVTVTGTSGSMVQTTNLNLTVNTPTSYSISAGTPNPSKISPGSTSSVPLNLVSANGYTGMVTLSCSVAPVVSPPATCSISGTNPVTVSSSGGSASVTFATAGPTAALRHSVNALYALWLPLPALAFIGLSAGAGAGRRKKRLGLLALWTVLAFTVVLPACGSGSNGSSGSGDKKTGTSGTPAGTYTIAITGKDANGLSQSNAAPAVTITVN